MKLTITVTKEILEKSKMCGQPDGPRFIPENCALALAVREIFPAASVSGRYLRPFGYEIGNDAELWMPESMTRFIHLFDRTPCEQRPNLPEQTFELELPDWVIDRIDISEITRALENHPNLKLQTV